MKTKDYVFLRSTQHIKANVFKHFKYKGVQYQLAVPSWARYVDIYPNGVLRIKDDWGTAKKAVIVYCAPKGYKLGPKTDDVVERRLFPGLTEPTYNKLAGR